MPGRVYGFDRFRLDAGARLLFLDEHRIPLTPKAVDVLIALLENRGTAVGREELFHRVWPDTAVEDGTLSSHISLLRKTVGAKFIETIPKRGYRFVGDVAEVRAEPERVLLAVLPFENLSGSRRYDSFSDGLTEEMITQLGRLNPSRLGVIARTSSMTYKSTEKTIEQIGSELAVSYVLEGSVRRAGNQVRIGAQLIQVSDQTHLWGDSYENALQDILVLQRRVSAEVAKQIRIRLLPRQTARPVVPAAYEACLAGRYLWNRRSEQEIRASVRSFREAIALDPAYAPAYAGMADSYLTMMDRGHITQREAMAEARPAIAKALELDDTLPEAHVSLGHAALHEFDWPTALRELQRAIELNPSYPTARHYYSNYLASMARMDEALSEAEQSTLLDPMSPAVHSNLSSILWFRGDYRRAVESAGRSLELNPDFSRANEDLGRAYEQLGAFDAAIDAFRKAIAIDARADGTLASLGHTFAVAGNPGEAGRILRKLQRLARTGFVSAYYFAVILVGLGRMDEVFARLQDARDERSSALPFLGVNPRFAKLRTDPRFLDLVENLGIGVAATDRSTGRAPSPR